MSAEILDSEESAALPNLRRSKTFAKSHKHVFMPNVSQNNQTKLLEPNYWPENTAMNKTGSHEPTLYHSQRKISISDFPSFKNYNSINSSIVDSKSTQVDSEVQFDQKKSLKAELSFDSNSKFSNFDYKKPEFSRIF